MACLLLSSAATASTCIPFHQAAKYIGETKCVTGKVLRVKEGSSGVTFFDFCEDYRLCTFTVVVFPRDLKDVGDVRQLAGKEVEIHGPIKMYDGRAEIILQRLVSWAETSGESRHCPRITMSKRRAVTAPENSAVLPAGSRRSRSSHPACRQKKKWTPWDPNSSCQSEALAQEFP